MASPRHKKHTMQEIGELRYESYRGTLSELEAKRSLDYYEVARNDNDADSDSSVDVELTIEVVHPHNKHDEPNEFYEELFENMKPLLKEIYDKHFMWSEDLQPRSDNFSILEFSGFIDNLNKRSVGASSTPKKTNLTEQQMSLMSNESECTRNLLSNHSICSNFTTNNTYHIGKSNEDVTEVKDSDSIEKITNENKKSSDDQLLMIIEGDSNPIKSNSSRMTRVGRMSDRDTNSTYEENNSNESGETRFDQLMDIEAEAKRSLDYYEVASNHNDEDSDSSIDVDVTIEIVHPHNRHDEPKEYYEKLFERMKPVLKEIYYKFFMWAEDLQPRSDNVNILEFSGFIENLNKRTVGSSSTPKNTNLAEQQMSLMSNVETSNNLSISCTNTGKDQLVGEESDCAQNLSWNHSICSNTTTNNTDRNGKSNEDETEAKDTYSNQKTTNENKKSSFDQLIDIGDSNPIKSNSLKMSCDRLITNKGIKSTQYPPQSKKYLISDIPKEHSLNTNKNQNVLKRNLNQANKRNKYTHANVKKSKKHKELIDFLKQPFLIGSPEIYHCSPVR